MEQDTFGIKNRIFAGNDCTGGTAGTYGIGKQVPQLVFNIFLAGLVIVMLSNIYHRNHKE